MDGAAPLLSVRGLSIAFPTTEDPAPAPVVRDVSLDVARGEFAAVVGESGCGKSLTAMSLTRLPPTDRALVRGSICFDGRELLDLPPKELRAVRGRGIAYVFQDPAGALNPVLRIRTQLAEALPPGTPRAEADRRLRALLETVRVPEPDRILRAYPHELSGGLQQRVGVAMAAAADPLLLVADEPTTALDATTQKSVLELLDSLRRERGIALLLITHNLGLVARHAESVHVMYAGEVVESGPAAEVLRAPVHPYTRGLFAAVPSLDMRGIDDLQGIPGRVPLPGERGEGCAFAPRCPHAEAACARPEARILHTRSSHAEAEGAAAARPISHAEFAEYAEAEGAARARQKSHAEFAEYAEPLRGMNLTRSSQSTQRQRHGSSAAHLSPLTSHLSPLPSSLPPSERGGAAGGAAVPRRVRCRRAFTLLETLTVILVLTVLAAIVVGQARLAKIRGEEARARAELGQIRSALEAYRDAFNFYPPSAEEENGKATICVLTNIHAWAHAPSWCLSDDPNTDDVYCLRNYLPGSEPQEDSVAGFSGLDPWNHPYFYRHDPDEAPDSYLLYSAGPDWRFDTMPPPVVIVP